jgi:hypothetical protein
MSSPAYALPLRLERQPSRYLMSTVIVVHGAALLVLLPLPLPWWIKVPLAAGIVAQWIGAWRNHVTLTAPAAVKTLVWLAENRWELFCADGASCEARLLPGAYVHPFLVILRFMTEDNRRCAVILPPGSLHADYHRRLRVRLRLHGSEQPIED